MGAWRAEIPPAFIDNYLPPSDPMAGPFIPRLNAAVDPVRWTKAEEQRFTRGDLNSKDKPAQNRSDKEGQPSTEDETGGDAPGDHIDPMSDNPVDNQGANGSGNDPLPSW